MRPSYPRYVTTDSFLFSIIEGESSYFQVFEFEELFERRGYAFHVSDTHLQAGKPADLLPPLERDGWFIIILVHMTYPLDATVLHISGFIG